MNIKSNMDTVLRYTKINKYMSWLKIYFIPIMLFSFKWTEYIFLITQVW